MEFNLNERSDVEETASFSLQADFEPVIDRKRGSIEEKALRVSQQTQSLRQNKIWSKSKIRISSTPGLLPPLVPQFRYSNFQIQLSKRSPEERSYTTLTTFETQRKRAPSGRDLQLSVKSLVGLPCPSTLRSGATNQPSLRLDEYSLLEPPNPALSLMRFFFPRDPVCSRQPGLRSRFAAIP